MKTLQQRFLSVNQFDQDIQIGPRRLSGDGNTKFLDAEDVSVKTNLIFTSTTIIKSAIGSGILALPYTVSKCGVVFSIIIFIVATALVQLSATVLLKAKNLSGHSNYATILYHIFRAKKAKAFASVFIVVGNMGVCIAEVIIFKKTVKKMMVDTMSTGSQSSNSFFTSAIFVALLFALLEVPLIWVRKIEKLRFMAFIGVIGLAVFTAAFFAHYAIASLDDRAAVRPVGGMNLFPSSWIAAVASIPNVIYSLAFMYNFYPIYKGMRQPTDRRMELVTLVSTIICSLLYLTVGILGYNLVGSAVSGNFLQSVNYDSTSPAIYFILNCSFLLSIYFTFPMVFFGSRNNFISLIDSFLDRGETKAIDDAEIGERREKRAFLVKTGVVFVMIVVVGLAMDDITLVYNAVGAICSTSNLFLLPFSFYILLVKRLSKERSIYFYLCASIFIIMIPFAVFTVIAKYAHL